MSSNKKILIELSGGVDSAATAYLLKQKGYDCIGAMMHLHDSPSIQDEIESAKNICKKLGIDFHLIDLRKQFRDNVIKYFIETYKNAKTPNPCILCNQKMKFGLMFDYAKQYGCDKIATGHYARIVCDDAAYQLQCAQDENKDQSYVLFFLNQERLSKIEFPLGQYSKEEIRKIAAEAGFECANKTDSQDICFIPDNDYKKFILDNSDLNTEPGNVVNPNGEILGQHQGLINYTIGQRKGLGLAFNEPKYVTKLNAKTNEVTLGSEKDTYQNEVFVVDINWISGTAPSNEFECEAKLRYRQKPTKCICRVTTDGATLIYEDGISAVTPGQFAVLYSGDIVLGGGIILN